MVASAACGADIVALEAALGLGLRTRVVLPFAPERFRTTSVVDRGKTWGPRFDKLVAAADARGDLVVLESDAGDDDQAYAEVVRRILQEAKSLAVADPLAIVIWDRVPRAFSDASKYFRDLAAGAGLKVVEIPTLPAGPD